MGLMMPQEGRSYSYFPGSQMVEWKMLNITLQKGDGIATAEFFINKPSWKGEKFPKIAEIYNIVQCT